MTMTSQLPGKSYRELVGRDEVLEEITTALLDPSGRWIIAIDGIGGIGKTALAREIAERCLLENMFDVVVWDQVPKEPEGLSTKPGIGLITFETVLDSIASQLGAVDVPRLKGTEKETRVKQLLQHQRSLIILDNLNVSKESQIEIVNRSSVLLNPSKALITSRRRLQGNVFAVHLTGLDEDEALRFIQQEAQEKKIQSVLDANISALKQIAENTGGTPLALKLIVGQLGHLSLISILDHLRFIQFPKDMGEETDYNLFYRSIFLPFWEQLSKDAKQLLIAMSVFVSGLGCTFEALTVVSDMSADLVRHSLDELYKCAFVEISTASSTKQTRYYLHPLTQHFVLTDIVKTL